MNFSLAKDMVAYGDYYITKAGDVWHVTKSGKDKSVLFIGSYDECIRYCQRAYRDARKRYEV